MIVILKVHQLWVFFGVIAEHGYGAQLGRPTRREATCHLSARGKNAGKIRKQEWGVEFITSSFSLGELATGLRHHCWKCKSRNILLFAPCSTLYSSSFFSFWESLYYSSCSRVLCVYIYFVWRNVEKYYVDTCANLKSICASYTCTRVRACHFCWFLRHRFMDVV